MADSVARPVARRTRLDIDEVRALVGGAFLVLSIIYVFSTLRRVLRS